MKKTRVGDNLRERWRGMTAEERTAYNRRIAQMPRTEKRCFCGQESMWVAANRYFDCCRKAGVVTVNLKRKKELNDERKRKAAQPGGD